MKILTFGEIMLRLASPGYTKLFQKDTLEATFCGAEANVAVSMATLGLDVAFLTVLPQNDVAKASVNTLRYFGVDTSKIIYGDGRMGLYYLEKGASQRPSKVIYDRSYSAISLAKPDLFDWDMIFQGVTHFHWSGINPALSDSLAEICLTACKEAHKKGIVISCDLNYRKNLWNSTKAKSTMEKIMPYVDICIGNEEDADKVLGINASDNDVESGHLNQAAYAEVAKKICQKFGCQYVAFTLRESYSASRNGWSGMLYNTATQNAYFSKQYDIQIIDRVGGGDSFTAGLLYGLIQKYTEQDCIEFAAAASCLKQTIEGDFNRSTVQDVEHLMQSGGNGRVQR